MKIIFTLIVGFFSLCNFAIAEVYLKFEPVMTLGEIKETYPNAVFEKQYVAWLNEENDFYKISGTGLSGTIYIKFNDNRRSIFANSSTEKLDGKSTPVITYKDFLKTHSDDDFLYTGWVRIVPDAPIPIHRLVLKYGASWKNGLSDETFLPYKEWKKKGIVAILSDNEKFATSIEYSFTREDVEKYFNSRGRVMPPWVKNLKWEK